MEAIDDSDDRELADAAVAVDVEADVERINADTVAQELECTTIANAEEFLASEHGVVMLPYQKQMFLDLAYMDGLIVCAK